MLRRLYQAFRCKWMDKHSYHHVETNVFRHKIYLYFECDHCKKKKTKKY